MLGIEAIAHVFGGERVASEVVAERHGFDLDFIKDKLGIDARYVATSQEATSDLAISAVNKLLRQTGMLPGEVGFLSVVTQTPDYQLPHVAALVQNSVGIPDSAATFDVGLGCSGYVYGLSIATAFMEANGIAKGILVTTDTYSKVIDPQDRATAPLFTDAASATLLGEAPRYALGRGVYGTDGKGADRLIVKGGGSRMPNSIERLFMDGRAIFNFMLARVPAQVSQCLELNDRHLEEVDCFIFHQANRFMLDTLCQKLRLTPEKMAYALRDCGNAVGSSIPIALEQVFEENYDLILLSGFGVGLSWATNLLLRIE